MSNEDGAGRDHRCENSSRAIIHKEYFEFLRGCGTEYQFFLKLKSTISLLENSHNSDYFSEKYEVTPIIAHLTYDTVDFRTGVPYIPVLKKTILQLLYGQPRVKMQSSLVN